MGPTGGHYNGNKMDEEVLEMGFFWHTIFSDAQRYIQACHNYQCIGNISHRYEMHQNPIINCETFDIWGIDFMGPFPTSLMLIMLCS